MRHKAVESDDVAEAQDDEEDLWGEEDEDAEALWMEDQYARAQESPLEVFGREG